MSNEHEEYEEIPWSSLVAEARGGPDRRWYLVAGGVAVLVVAVVGFRLLGGETRQPVAGAPVHPETTTTESSQGSLVVSEAELKPDAEPESDAEPPSTGLVRLRAEWFVIDFYTHDGSEETRRSLRAAVDPLVEVESLSIDETGGATFVEWAKAFRIEHTTPGEYTVSVAYRRIRSNGESFEREPVRAVAVPIRMADGEAAVVAVPTAIAVP